MNVHNVQQRSEAWFEARRGMPTASRFDMILTPTQGKPAAAQETLINLLIAESVLPPTEGLVPGHITEEMRQGIVLEAEARCAWELNYAKGQVHEVGFIVHESSLFGGSPDALLGDNSGCEIKCPQPAQHIGYIREGVLPTQYKNQVHGYMIITGRKEWEFFSYTRNFDPFHLRIEWDEFTNKLEAELYRFCERYNAERVKFGLSPFTAAKINP